MKNNGKPIKKSNEIISLIISVVFIVLVRWFFGISLSMAFILGLGVILVVYLCERYWNKRKKEKSEEKNE